MSPFRILVLDKDRYLKGEVGGATRVQLVLRHNLPGSCEFTVPLTHPRLADLLAPGALVIVDYSPITDRPAFTGQVRKVVGDLASKSVTITVRGALGLLNDVLGWPRPDQPLTGQNVEFDVRTGTAEQVIKAYVAANARDRLGLPVTIAPDHGYGIAVSAQARFMPLADVLANVTAVSLLGISVELQRPTGIPARSPGLLVDVYVPRNYPRTLTDRSGIVQDWTLTRTAPTGTRTVLGGPGEKAGRGFYGDVDTASEAQVGLLGIVESFVDASIGGDLFSLNAALTAAQATQAATPTPANAQAVTDAQAALTAAQNAFNAAVQQEFAKARAAGAGRDGLTVTLAETATFRVGDALRPGDNVTLEVGGQTVSDVLTECTINLTDKGLDVTPTVGDVVSFERRLSGILDSFARAIRSKGVR